MEEVMARHRVAGIVPDKPSPFTGNASAALPTIGRHDSIPSTDQDDRGTYQDGAQSGVRHRYLYRGAPPLTGRPDLPFQTTSS